MSAMGWEERRMRGCPGVVTRFPSSTQAGPAAPGGHLCSSDGLPSTGSVVKDMVLGTEPGLRLGSTTSCLGQLGPVT